MPKGSGKVDKPVSSDLQEEFDRFQPLFGETINNRAIPIQWVRKHLGCDQKPKSAIVICWRNMKDAKEAVSKLSKKVKRKVAVPADDLVRFFKTTKFAYGTNSTSVMKTWHVKSEALKHLRAAEGVAILWHVMVEYNDLEDSVCNSLVQWATTSDKEPEYTLQSIEENKSFLNRYYYNRPADLTEEELKTAIAVAQKVLEEMKTKPCFVCDKAESKFCSKCKTIRYCSRACQQPDWHTNHKFLCEEIGKQTVVLGKLAMGLSVKGDLGDTV